jgi:hypothetical protein
MAPVLGIWASSFNSRTFQPTGSYDALASYTVPSGGVSSITFAGLPTGGQYSHLQLRVMQLGTYGQYGALRFNDDSTNAYFWHGLYGNGSSATASAYGALTSSAYFPFNSGGSSNPAVGILDILDYTSTSKNKVCRSLEGADQNGSGAVALCSFNWNSTTAINKITITGTGTSWAQYSQFSLYGVKG